MNEKQRQVDQSDLLEWANHEHKHLDRLFMDLRGTFERIVAGEVDRGHVREVVEQAVEDLDGALGDMLEHFADEEEVYFLAIEQRFPEHKPKIAALVETHDELSTRTKELRARLAREGAGSSVEGVGEWIEELRELYEILERHNAEEQELFDNALKLLSSHERAELLEHRQSLG